VLRKIQLRNMMRSEDFNLQTLRAPLNYFMTFNNSLLNPQLRPISNDCYLPPRHVIATDLIAALCSREAYEMWQPINQLWNVDRRIKNNTANCNLPYILESNPPPFYSFRGLKNQMRIRIACRLDSRSWAGFWKIYRAAVRAVRTIQYNNLLFCLLFITLFII